MSSTKLDSLPKIKMKSVTQMAKNGWDAKGVAPEGRGAKDNEEEPENRQVKKENGTYKTKLILPSDNQVKPFGQRGSEKVHDFNSIAYPLLLQLLLILLLLLLLLMRSRKVSWRKYQNLESPSTHSDSKRAGSERKSTH